MYYGQPYGAYGDPEKHIKIMEAEATTTGGRVRIQPSAGLGNAYYQVYVNNIFAASIWCAEGVLSEWVNILIPSTGTASIVAFRLGAQPDFDNSFFASLSEEAPQNVTSTWTWAYEVIGTPTVLTMTGWTISGLTRLQTTQGEKVTRGSVQANIYVDAGTAIVSVGNLASGTGPVDSTITLTALNGSGVTGTVYVAADAVTASGLLNFRWPLSMQILRDDTSPPTTVIATVTNGGGETGTFTDTELLDVGTYYYAFRAISDTDDIGDQSAPQTITVTGAPGAVEVLAYVSGNAAATVVSWSESSTVGATYNIYVADVDDAFLDTETPTQTAVTESTGITLSAITGYPGIAQVLVRAEFSGVEELNGNILFLEYDSAGDYISPRPNAPTISSVSVSSGLSISVTGVYSIENQDGVATALQLFTRTPSGTYDFATVESTGTLGSTVNGVKKATTTKTLATDGWYYCTLKAVTSTGIQSIGSATEVLFFVSDDNIAAPSGTFTLSRG